MMRFYIIVDPINHVFQLGVVTPFGLMPPAEFPVKGFEVFRKQINDAWALYQKSVLGSPIVQYIQSIEEIDKIKQDANL